MDVAMVDQLEETLLTTTKPDPNIPQCCVIAFKPRYAVSFQHGPHSKFKVGEEVILYSVIRPQVEYKTIVQAMCDVNDVIVFELKNKVEFDSFATELGCITRCQRYYQLGVNEIRRPTWKDGIIAETHFSFFVGTTHGRQGDSGSAIYNETGRFLGIAVGKKNLQVQDRRMLSLSEVADHHPVIKIISSSVISGVMAATHQKFEPPRKKTKL
ncbi:unnamed protein product [Auanema sp. JU1783]|nr:unnamed protein product [Auanema sp. JU1783]